MTEELDNTSKFNTKEKLVPPHNNLSWYVKFFEKIQKKDFDRFDTEIIDINIIGGRNAQRMFQELRFLGLVEEDGRVTDDFKSLRRFGDEFKQNLKKIVERSYSPLFEKVALESANNETLLNFFAKYYDFGEVLAKRAIKIFVYLCERADIPIPKELTVSPPKNDSTVTKTKTIKPKINQISRDNARGKGTDKAKDDLVDLKGMHQISWGSTIRIFLKEGEDKNERLRIANQAKKLIDMYVEE